MNSIRVKFGLIGFPLGHSFSKKYYDRKFNTENIQDIGYELYPLPDLSMLPSLLASEPLLNGINVTIPYKVDIIHYLSDISQEAEAVGAVNCVRIDRSDPVKPCLKGFNTDVFGFRESLVPILSSEYNRALVFGSGGASKAVCYVLEQLGLPYRIVSRKQASGEDLIEALNYRDISPEVIASYPLIINTTPLGTFPSVDDCPPIPLDGIGSEHLVYDLIYNPEKTRLLKEAEKRGAKIKNGYEMLVLQADRNWAIWNGDF